MSTRARLQSWNSVDPIGPPHALRFPSNTIESPRLLLTGANLLPFTPATYIWEVTPAQQTGYYTTFFHANNGAFNAGQNYYGFHPYPNPAPNGTVHNWEISANGTDVTTDDNGNDTTVVKGVKYLQAAKIEVVSTNYVMTFYWSLPTTTKVITYTFPTSNYSAPASPAVQIGGNAWASTTENLSGDLGRWKIFSAALSLSDIVSESSNFSYLVTSSGSSNIWFGKKNWRSLTDLSCDYNTGHSLVWVDTNNKSTLVTAS